MNPECLTAVALPPGTDMTGICFKDQLWLSTYPLDRNLVFDYFARSPFYDWTCNNEQLRMRSIHPLDLSHLSIMNFESDGKGVKCPRAQAQNTCCMKLWSPIYLSCASKRGMVLKKLHQC